MKKQEKDYGENEQDAFANFKFLLGQRVQHRIDELEGIIVQRKLVQNQHGGTGHAYWVAFGPGQYAEVLEIELEAVDAEED